MHARTSGLADYLAEDELDDAAGVGERGVERRHPGTRQIIQGKLVGTNAEGPHRRQRLTAFRNDLGGDLGARSNAQQVDPVECLDEFVLTQCPGDTFNLVTSLAQGSYSLVMDVLEQKRLHAGQSREGTHRVSRDETTTVVCSSRPCEEAVPSTLDEWPDQRHRRISARTGQRHHCTSARTGRYPELPCRGCHDVAGTGHPGAGVTSTVPSPLHRDGRGSSTQECGAAALPHVRSSSRPRMVGTAASSRRVRSCRGSA